MKILPAESLGKRIMIIGPSSTGKSTLADALGKKLGIKAYHLDQIAHIPNSNFKRRPDAEFISDHEKIMENEEWVVDGNYSITMNERLKRAKLVIWLDYNPLYSVYNFIMRCFKPVENRKGHLEGAKDNFNIDLIKHTLFTYPKNKAKYQMFLKYHHHLPVIYIHSMKELNEYYKHWELER